MRTAAALLVLVLLLFLNPAVVAAAPPAARMDLAVLLWESAGAVPFAAGGAFSDVARNDDGATAAAWCREAGLLLGTGDGRFSPDRPLTREELAVALRRYARILGRDTFLPAGAAECNDYADISPWADDSLYWACDAGVLNWSEGGRLAPGGPRILAQLQAVLEDFLAR